ncbi:MAG: hypothetical protein B6I32_05065 [Desulfobacterium sp. 4572_20]|nr:MAG: hypothetical protein B6I32_05065 [Desulfobacterium sp. 4572_20]
MPKHDDINLSRLINIGKDKGYITYKELNEDLSDDIISSEDIDDLLQMFEDLNIKVVNEPVGGQIEKVKKTEEADEEGKIEILLEKPMILSRCIYGRWVLSHC